MIDNLNRKCLLVIVFLLVFNLKPKTQVIATSPTVASAELVNAIKKGTPHEVRSLLSEYQTPDIFADKRKKNTLLTFAIHSGREEIVDCLLLAGASPNFSSYARTPLGSAVYINNRQIVRKLIMAGANPNQEDQLGRISLHFVRPENDIRMARLLVEAGARIAKRDHSGKSIMSKVDGERYPVLYNYLQSMLQVQNASALWPSFKDGPYVVDFDSLTYKISWFYHDSAQRKTFRVDTIVEKKPQVVFYDRQMHCNRAIMSDMALVNNNYQSDKNDTIVVVGDVHGQLKQLLGLLKNAGIVDNSSRWNYRKNRLIFIGDLVDRGDEVTQTLWFVHDLMIQAKESGGEVVYLLGNHEELLLVGDISYVHSNYTNLWRYFNYSSNELFSMESYLGKFMRTRPAMFRSGKTLFVHAGVSKELLESKLPFDSINYLVKNFFTSPVPSISDTERLLMLDKGPLWSRSYFKNFDTTKSITDSIVDLTLKQFDVDRIVVGHTEVPQIVLLFDGKVVAVNVPFSDTINSQVLMIINDNKLFKILSNGSVQQLIQTLL